MQKKKKNTNKNDKSQHVWSEFSRERPRLIEIPSRIRRAWIEFLLERGIGQRGGVAGLDWLDVLQERSAFP